MSKSATRTMFAGTEGNEDYLVAARKNGFVLGLKPLLAIGQDASGYGFRVRMQRAVGGEPDIKGQAELDKMLEVFPNIPWQKRSEKRFSTVIMKEATFGVAFLSKIVEEFEKHLDEMLDEVASHFADDESWLNLADLKAFTMETVTETAAKIQESYDEYLGKKKAEQESHGDVVQFPGKDDDKVDV